MLAPVHRLQTKPNTTRRKESEYGAAESAPRLLGRLSSSVLSIADWFLKSCGAALRGPAPRALHPTAPLLVSIISCPCFSFFPLPSRVFSPFCITGFASQLPSWARSPRRAQFIFGESGAWWGWWGEVASWCGKERFYSRIQDSPSMSSALAWRLQAPRLPSPAGPRRAAQFPPRWVTGPAGAQGLRRSEPFPPFFIFFTA